MNRFASLLSNLIALLMPFFIILSSLYVFMTPDFVRFEYAQPGFPPAERFSADARLYNATETVRYVRGEISLSDLENLGVYNAREIKHLVDVRNVANLAFATHAVSGILILLGFIVLAWSPLTRPRAARALIGGAILTFALIAAIGIFSLVAFDQFFVTFHHIFFEGDTWLFNYTDSLIQFYPLPFWETVSYAIALFVALLTVAVGAVGWIWLRLMNRSARLPQVPAPAH